MTEARRLPYEKIRYRATLTGLSPIHIGGGAPEPACRYAIDEDTKTAYVLRESFVASRYAEGRITGSEYHRRPSPASVVPKTEPERSEAVLYEVKAPRVAASLDKEARPFVRNGFGQAFIPGTSIKGAIREALLFSLLVQDDRLRGEIAASVRDLIAEMKKSNPQSANGIRRNRNHASRLEELFRNPGAGGRADPKNDILRCMAVEDTPPDNRGFTLAAANIFSLSGGVLAPMISQTRNGQSTRSAPVFLEFLDPGMSFPFGFTLDKALLEKLSPPMGKVQFRNSVDIIGALRDQADFTASLERTFFSEFDSSGKLWKKEYEGAGLKENQAVIRIGWGCGWMGHSLFPLLGYSENDVAESPKSRKVLVSQNGNPLSLLGYAVLTLQEE